jgi:prepilin-type N-terminal cleavage/methylation domain-containing protein
MKIKITAFTLVEVLIAVVIIAILSSLGVAVWDGSVDNARQKICAQNQTILMESLKMFVYDKDAVPTTLSDLEPAYIELALAKIEKKDYLFKPIRTICLAFIRINDGKEAWAIPLSDYVKIDSNVTRCPANNYGATSYGINNSITNTATFKQALNNNVPIICDCDNTSFSSISDAAYRHGGMFSSKRIAIYTDGGKPKEASINISQLLTETNNPPNLSWWQHVWAFIRGLFN